MQYAVFVWTESAPIITLYYSAIYVIWPFIKNAMECHTYQKVSGFANAVYTLHPDQLNVVCVLIEAMVDGLTLYADFGYQRFGLAMKSF